MSASHSPEPPASPEGKPKDLHDTSHDHEHFHDHAGLYLLIGGILMAGTVLTVYLAYVDFGSHELNIAMGLLLAAVKATLVALIFMHLKSEKMTIYQFMFFTVIFVIGLFGLSILAFFDPIRF